MSVLSFPSSLLRIALALLAALLLAWLAHHVRTDAPRPSAPPASSRVMTEAERAAIEAIERIARALPPPRAAEPGEAASTVVLLACTATRVGPRHFLTAAHCLVNPSTFSLKEELTAGLPITLWSQRDEETSPRPDAPPPAPAARPHEVIVEEVRLHPRYRPDLDRAFAERDSRPDVAVVLIDRLLDVIPITPVSARTITDGQEVTLVGTRGLGWHEVPRAPDGRRRKVIPARVVSSDPLFALDDAFGRVFWQAAGPSPERADWAIDLGDSGGASLAMRAGREVVVGVHAIVLSRTTADTRLDDDSGVAPWLESVGVAVVRD